MKLTPYLNFTGNASEAIEFYKNSLNGEVVMISRYGDSQMVTEEDWKQKIMHARIVFGGDNMLMISDTMKNRQISTKGNIQLSISLENETLAHEIFDRLSDGGEVKMPLAKAFWGDIFGMLTDKFGTSWLINCAQKV